MLTMNLLTLRKGLDDGGVEGMEKLNGLYDGKMMKSVRLRVRSGEL